MRRKRSFRFSGWTGLLGAFILGTVLGLQLLWWKWVNNPFDAGQGIVLRSLNPESQPTKETPKQESGEISEQSSEQRTTASLATSLAKGEAPTGEHSEGEDTRPSQGLSLSSEKCRWSEYSGEYSPTQRKVRKAHWSSIQTEFLQSKNLLAQWLQTKREELSQTQYHKMSYELSRLEIERPPYENEPDLAWRSVVLLTAQPGSKSLRFGMGFIELLQADPRRARFEMVRAIAKVWAPCALSVVGGSLLWQSLLNCLEVRSPVSCKEGSYSEHAWAVSTALAVALVPLSCRIPAVSLAQQRSCLSPVALSASGEKTSFLQLPALKGKEQ